MPTIGQPVTMAPGGQEILCKIEYNKAYGQRQMICQNQSRFVVFLCDKSRADIHNHLLVRAFNSVLGMFGDLFRMNEPIKLE